MAYMFVRHSVKDFEAWKSVFDSVGDLRERNGEKSYQILREDNGSNDLFLLFEWDNLDNARKYAASPELKAAMERAGVTGPPDISFLEEAARQGHRPTRITSGTYREMSPQLRTFAAGWGLPAMEW